MRLLIAGGTGRAGRVLARRAVAAGHDVAVLSRSATAPIPGATVLPGDVTTGAGLAAAMVGVEAVVDATNLVTLSARAATRFFAAGTTHLVDAGRQAGVAHHLVLSIVGIDAFPGGYYRAKLAQERVAAHRCATAGITCTVARVTQFHDFAAMSYAGGRVGPLVVVPPLHLRPVHLHDVADHLLQQLADRTPGRAPDLSGPRPEVLDDMVLRYAGLWPRHGRVVRLPLPGAYGRADSAGVLARTAVHGRLDFDHWLQQRRPIGLRPPEERDQDSGDDDVTA